MPEQLIKHSDATLEVLRSAGAQCGTGEPPQVLTACPAERFCKLPGGEVCVYGVAEASQMTQIAQADWKTLAAVTVSSAPLPQPGPGPGDGLLAGSAGGLVVGAILGVAFSRSRRPRP